MHNTRKAHWSIEPHSIFLNESVTGDPWNGLVDLPLTKTLSSGTTEDVVKIKAEIFLFDSKECPSSVRIEYFELGSTEVAKASLQESPWIPVSERAFI